MNEKNIQTDEDDSQDKTIIIQSTPLSKAIGADLIFCYVDAGCGDAGFSSISIDSRTLVPGALFVALIGEVQDGHRYIEAAFGAGAAAAMIARSRWEDSRQGLTEIARTFHGIFLVVEDTLKGLQKAATYYLDQFPGLLKIGITGSSGKTTTKEIAAAIISREKLVVMNQGNMNSETGLPLSVFQVRPYHEVGIFEMAASKKGEIEALARIVKPHIALITNIGSAHIGFFGTKQAIAEEKKGIFSEFSGNEIALIPAGDPYRDFLAESVKGQVVFYGSRTAALGEVQDRGIEGFVIVWEEVSVQFRLPGTYNLQNALAATAVAGSVPVSSQAIREGLASMESLFGRTEILSGPVTVIRDCYNSNPESMMAAIEFCDGLDWAGRRIYVIGSMLEQGTSSQEAHEMIGRCLGSSRADMVCFYGEETRAAAESLSRTANRSQTASFFQTDSMDVLSEFLSSLIQPGDLVLLKGSRGCALEQLTNILMSPIDGGTAAVARGAF